MAKIFNWFWSEGISEAINNKQDSRLIHSTKEVTRCYPNLLRYFGIPLIWPLAWRPHTKRKSLPNNMTKQIDVIYRYCVIRPVPIDGLYVPNKIALFFNCNPADLSACLTDWLSAQKIHPTYVHSKCMYYAHNSRFIVYRHYFKHNKTICTFYRSVVWASTASCDVRISPHTLSYALIQLKYACNYTILKNYSKRNILIAI